MVKIGLKRPKLANVVCQTARDNYSSTQARRPNYIIFEQNDEDTLIQIGQNCPKLSKLARIGQNRPIVFEQNDEDTLIQTTKYCYKKINHNRDESFLKSHFHFCRSAISHRSLTTINWTLGKYLVKIISVYEIQICDFRRKQAPLYMSQTQ